MAQKNYQPYTASRRYITTTDTSDLTKKAPEKALLESIKRSGGRNNQGRITADHRGGGAKRLYRIVDFKRSKTDINAKVVAIEYDPNRSANIALLQYVDGVKSYILAPLGLKIGDSVIASDDADILPGNVLTLKQIPVGTNIHNLELKIGKGGVLVRSAGMAAQIMGKEGDYAQVKLPSGEVRLIHARCRATIGQVGNLDHENVTLGKAGRTRYLGKRPHVRGMAMNPVDHPHGGGEGRSKGGNHPTNVRGLPSKGYKTRGNKRTQRFIVKDRRK
ncbi:MAG: 50S ribosomal protein L2 [Deltaproteobacteria bacterium CG11_big_fil_rev_8_21_14_0_20_47_16]|nr:MAG: 50S ribosomal protein L2 [Deltaproteobacteria bacterium CG11_big_fil_rev_8_21_14_0_20_47_16]